MQNKARHQSIKGIKIPGINIYKRVELNTNYLNPEHQGDELYGTPQSIIDVAKEEKPKMKAFEIELNEGKVRHMPTRMPRWR